MFYHDGAALDAHSHHAEGEDRDEQVVAEQINRIRLQNAENRRLGNVKSEAIKMIEILVFQQVHSSESQYAMNGSLHVIKNHFPSGFFHCSRSGSLSGLKT